jgi:hypothetical protein
MIDIKIEMLKIVDFFEKLIHFIRVQENKFLITDNYSEVSLELIDGFKNIDNEIYRLISQMLKNFISEAGTPIKNYKICPYNFNDGIEFGINGSMVKNIWFGNWIQKKDEYHSYLRDFLFEKNNYRNHSSHGIPDYNVEMHFINDGFQIIIVHHCSEGIYERSLDCHKINEIKYSLIDYFIFYDESIKKMQRIKNITDKELNALEMISEEQFEMKKYFPKYNPITERVERFTENLFICDNPQSRSDYMSFIMENFKSIENIDKYIDNDGICIGSFNGSQNFIEMLNSIPVKIKEKLFQKKSVNIIPDLYLEDSLPISINNNQSDYLYFMETLHKNTNEKTIDAFFKMYINDSESANGFAMFICKNNNFINKKNLRYIEKYVDYNILGHIYQHYLSGGQKLTDKNIKWISGRCKCGEPCKNKKNVWVNDYEKYEKLKGIIGDMVDNVIDITFTEVKY